MDTKKLVRNIKACQTAEDIFDTIQDLDMSELAARHFVTINRKIEELKPNPDVRIAYLSNFTVDMLPPFFNVYAASEGIWSNGYVGAYNQYFQELLSEENPLIKYEPHFIILFLSLKHLDPNAYYGIGSMKDSKKADSLNKIKETIEEWIEIALGKTFATILVSNFIVPDFVQKGIADCKDSYSEIQFYENLNRILVEMSWNNPRLQIFDIKRLAAIYGSRNIIDSKMYYLAKIMWKESFNANIAEWLLRHIMSSSGLSRKCLVLDLDNTLWGGVVGEDGPEGIKIGPGDPNSEAYFDFQHKIKALKNRGIMLAICSKNNYGDVLEVFNTRKDMPLQLDDFTTTKINWDSKHVNLEQIAKELNIGLDSMVFIDDSPTECALIRKMLPEVKMIQLPQAYEKISEIIENLPYFEKTVILREDIVKTEQYRHNIRRSELRSSSGNLADYLNSLKTEVSIWQARESNRERIHQLFTKTNQFNVTTIRYNPGDIEKFIVEENFDLHVISSKDRFGDIGIIGLVLLENSCSNAKIDSFILSCRAMGRGIETAIMNYLKKDYFERKEFKIIRAKYIPTPKNLPVKDFFKDQGFHVIRSESDGQTGYELDKSTFTYNDCDWIKINES